MKPTTPRLLALATLALPTVTHATVIVSENFGGLAANNLNGTAADTFDSGIATAGGSATWVAATQFKANGSVTTLRNSAYLNLGSYINDAKGTATGLFTLHATIAQPTGTPARFVSLGFATQNAPSSNFTFNDQSITGPADPAGQTTGVGTMIYRVNGDIDSFAGPSSTLQVAPDDVFESGTRTLTITLDFTPDGGWNGTDNFGTVTFGADTGVGNAYEEYGSHLYTVNNPFGSILLSVFGDANTNSPNTTVTTTYDNLTLTQIPEPSTALLGGLGVLALLRRRR